MHVLPVGGDHGQHHQGDGQPDLPAEGVGRHARDRQHDEDLVGRVGHGGQGVAGEDRQRDPLREQRLAQLGAPQLAAQQDPLGDIADTHVGQR